MTTDLGISKINKNLPPPRLSIHTCEGLYEKLKIDYANLEKDWHEYNTFNFMITAYHLFYDWIDKVSNAKQRRRRGKLSTNAKTLFKIVRELANANKHWDLDKSNKEKQIVTGISEKLIGDFYAYLYSGPVNYVEIGRVYIGIPVLASLIMKCLDWIIHGESDTFPMEIEEILNHYLTNE